MKKVTLLLLGYLCVLLSTTTQAQGDLETQLATVLEHIDTGPVAASTGIWYDKVPPYIDYKIMPYDHVEDSLRLTTDGFRWIHEMLAYAHLDTLQSPLRVDGMWERIEDYKRTDLVTLGSILYSYDRFRDDVIEDSLIYYDGTAFRHHPSATETPFIRDTVVVGAAIYEGAVGDTVRYYMPSDLYYTNMSAVTAVSIDFGDGAGYQVVVFDEVKEVVYTSIDTFDIDIRYTLSTGDTVYAGTQVVVTGAPQAAYEQGLISKMLTDPAFNTEPDGRHHIGTAKQKCIRWEMDVDHPENGVVCVEYGDAPTTGVEIYYWINQSNCETPKIRKPLIICDGFDPMGERSFEFLIDNRDGILDREYELPKTLKDLIHDEGYDLFFINFVEGATHIQTNAAHMKAAIEWINAQKALNGSSEDNIVIGPSMGGLISKWALREFELNGEDHETELLITMDSPLRGANVPLAFQALPLRLGSESVLFRWNLRDFSSDLRSGYKKVNSPAARQMLYYHLALNEEPNIPVQTLTEWHDDFYNEFWGRGDLDIPHIAMSNGSVLRQRQQFTPSTRIVKVRKGIVTPSGFGLSFISADGFSLPGNSFDRTFYSQHLTHTILGNTFNGSRNQLRLFGNIINYDSAPGGMTTFDKNEGDNTKVGKDFVYKSFCFIPTISALDIRTTDDPFAEIESNVGPHIRSYQGSTMATRQFGDVQHNQEHVSFTKSNAEYFLYITSKQKIEGDLYDRTFNFGKGEIGSPNDPMPYKTSRVIDKDVNVGVRGRLWVNRFERIAYTDVLQNKANNSPQRFDVYLMKDCDDPIIVKIKDMGELHVGDITVDNVGSLVVTAENQLWVEKGGRAIIEDGSSLVVEKDGVLELFEGSTMIVEGKGTIDIQEGGKLIVHDGAQIILQDGSSIVLQEEGEMELFGGSTLDVDGSGFIDIQEGGKFIVHDGANIILKAPSVQGISFEDGNHGSHIDMAGDLILDSTLKIDGDGICIFQPNHSITVHKSLIQLIGAGKDHRSFGINTDVELFSQKVYLSSATFEMTSSIKTLGNNLYMTDCKMDAFTHLNIPELISPLLPEPWAYLWGKDMRDVVVKGVDFTDVPMYMDFHENPVVEGNNGPILGPEIDTRLEMSGVTSEIKYKNTNVQVSHAITVDIRNTHIYTKPFEAKDEEVIVRKGLVLKGCLNTDVKQSILEGYRLLETGNLVKDQRLALAALWLEHSSHVTMDKSTIKKSRLGVYNDGDFNLYMNFSTITDCKTGVKSDEVKSMGLVKMICSEISSCQSGIYGYDIDLAIDGLINAQGTDGTIRANRFLNNDAHFSINYVDKPVPDQILGRYNVWDNPETYFLPCPFIQKPYGSDECHGFVKQDCLGAAPSFPQMDAGVAPPMYIGLQGNPVTCDSYDILEHYWRGYTCLDNGDVESALNSFTKIAKEYYSVTFTLYSTEIQQLIREVVNIVYAQLPGDMISTTIQETITSTTYEISTVCDTVTLDPSTHNIHFLLDASNSVNSTEFDQMLTTLRNTLHDISSNGVSIAYSVSQFSGSSQYEVTIPLTTDIALADSIARAYSNGTHVRNAVTELTALLDSSVDSKVVIFTDAVSSQFYVGNNYDPYDALKQTYGSDVIVVRYQEGNDDDKVANAICAQIASKGGGYSDEIAYNPNDMDGNEGPRKLYTESFTTYIPGLGNTVVNCVDVSIPITITDEIISIVWTATDGGEIITTTTNVTTITTTGTGTYTVTIVYANGCSYTDSFTFPSAENGSDTQGLVSGDVAASRAIWIDGVQYWPHELEGMVTSTEDREQEAGATVYPNPFRESVTIAGLRPDVEHTIRLVSVTGTVLEQRTCSAASCRMDLSNMPSGVYTLTISTANKGGQETHKVIKLQ